MSKEIKKNKHCNDFWRLIMRGISFKVNSSEKSVLSIILQNIDIEKLFCKITDDDITMDRDMTMNKDKTMNKDISIFTEEQVNGETFKNIISTVGYTVIFANIKAYPDKSMNDSINDYDDFLKSNCILIILCSDLYDYEIYSKSEEMIEMIKYNCIKKGYDEIEYITEENDRRTRLNVE